MTSRLARSCHLLKTNAAFDLVASGFEPASFGLRMRQLHKLLMIRRHRGWLGLARTLRSNIWSELEYWRLVLRLPAEGSTLPPLLPSGLVVKRAAASDLNQLRDFWRNPASPPAFLAGEIRGLDWCYLGFSGSHPVHVLWVATAEKPSTVPGWQLRGEEAEIRDVYTLAEFRGKGLAQSSLAVALADCTAAGIRRVFAHVGNDNSASRRVFAHAGFEPVFRIAEKRRMGWKTILSEPPGKLI